jgi:hypothetical protein
MGWNDDELWDHEGYAKAYVTDNGSLRELGFPQDVQDLARVEFVSAACECGWRSPRFYTPRAQYVPFIVCLPAEDDEKVHALWKEHIAHVRALQRVGLPLTRPLHRHGRELDLRLRPEAE